MSSGSVLDLPTSCQSALTKPPAGNKNISLSACPSIALRANCTTAVKFFQFIFPSSNKPYLNDFFFFLRLFYYCYFLSVASPSLPPRPVQKQSWLPLLCNPHLPPRRSTPGARGSRASARHPRLSRLDSPPAPAAPGAGPPRLARHRLRAPGRARPPPGLRPSLPVNSPGAAAAAGPSADTGPSPAGTAQPPARPAALARPLGRLRGTAGPPRPPQSPRPAGPAARGPRGGRTGKSWLTCHYFLRHLGSTCQRPHKALWESPPPPSSRPGGQRRRAGGAGPPRAGRGGTGSGPGPGTRRPGAVRCGAVRRGVAWRGGGGRRAAAGSGPQLCPPSRTGVRGHCRAARAGNRQPRRGGCLRFFLFFPSFF